MSLNRLGAGAPSTSPLGTGGLGQGGTLPAGYTPGGSIQDVVQGTSILMRGHSGEAVQGLQQLLNALGANPPLAEDGLFGPKTEAALKQLQGGMGLAQDGRFGAGTLAGIQQQAIFDRYSGFDGNPQNRYGADGSPRRAPLIGEERPAGTITADALRRAEEAPRGAGGAIKGADGSVLVDVPWISQFDRRVPGAGDTACYRACRVMMQRAGVNISPGTGNRLQVATGEDGLGRVRTTRDRTDAARGYIDQQLDAGKPVTVGISHKDASYNQDGITDHFVVITGRGTDAQGRTFYTYHDPATTNRDTGTNERFYIDQRNGNLVHAGQSASGYVVDRHTELSMVIRNP